MTEPTLRILPLGAGVQSTTLALMACDGTLPGLDAAIFADTGWEPPAVYRQVDRLEAELKRVAKIRGDALRETPAAVRFYSFEPLLGPIDDANLDGIHWVITGGESGPGARPAHPDSPGRKRARTRVDYARRTEEWERDTYDRLKAKFEGAKGNTNE